MPKPNHIGEAWCSQHGVHPKECFYFHYPQATKKEETLSEAEHRRAIILEHVLKQEESIKKYAEEHSRNPEELREKYNRAPKE